jgi:hypothetical protein
MIIFDFRFSIFRSFRRKNWLRFHHHPLPATKRRVIDNMVLVPCPIAQVVNVQVKGAFLPCALHHAFTQRSAADFWKQRDDFDSHWNKTSQAKR